MGKLVKVSLDFLNLEDVTIIGASLEVYLVSRATAFDKRITEVVCLSIFPIFLIFFL